MAYGYDPYNFQYQFVPIEKKPLPPPDKNWVDHVQANRNYLKSIQKVSVHKDFEGLKDAMLFLMEVSTGSVEFNKAVTDAFSPTKKGDRLYKVLVKFLDLSFLEVKEQSSDDTMSQIRESQSCSALFQGMFTPEKPDVIVVHSGSNTYVENEKADTKEIEPKEGDNNEELKEENKESKKSTEKLPSAKKTGHKKWKGKKERKLSKMSKTTSGSKERGSIKEVMLDKDVVTNESKAGKETKKHSVQTDEISKGTAVFLVMSSLAMLRSLQEHAINVKVDRCDDDKADKEKDGGSPDVVSEKKPRVTSLSPAESKPEAIKPAAENSEDLTLGTVVFRAPESLRRAVLTFVNKNTVLPARETHSDTYRLTNSKKEEIGQINITVTLTCFGNAVENCIRETSDVDEGGYLYEHTKCWRMFSKEEPEVPKMDPKLATLLMETAAAVKPKKWNSDELLHYGVGCGMVKVEDDQKRRALGNDCNWLRLVKQAKREVGPRTGDVLSKSMGKVRSPTVSRAALCASPLMASRLLITKETGMPITLLSLIWSNVDLAVNTPQFDVVATKQATEWSHLKDLWRDQRIINKGFKQQQEERNNRPNSLYERLEQLRALAPSPEEEKQEEPDESAESFLEDGRRSPTQKRNTRIQLETTNSSGTENINK